MRAVIVVDVMEADEEDDTDEESCGGTVTPFGAFEMSVGRSLSLPLLLVITAGCGVRGVAVCVELLDLDDSEPAGDAERITDGEDILAA